MFIHFLTRNKKMGFVEVHDIVLYGGFLINNEIERDETETCLEPVLFTVQWIDDHDYLACF